MKYYNCASGKRHLLCNKDNKYLKENSTKQKHVDSSSPLKHQFHTTTYILKENHSKFIEAYI